jgi:hypothetical protein
MRRFASHVLPFVLAAALAACGPSAPRVQRCADAHCPKGTRCDVATELCVQDLGPNVHLVPIAGVVTAPEVTLSGSVSDDTQVKLVQVRQGDEWVEVPLVEGRFTASVDAGLHDSETVTLEARAFDSLDQEGRASLEVTVDDVGPTIQAQGAADGGLFGATVVVVGKVHDGSGTVASFTGAIPGGAPQSISVGADGTFTAALQAPAGLDSAPSVVTLVATDASGNASSLALTLVVDSVAPTGTIENPPENDVVRASFTLWGTVQDNVGVASVRVRGPGGWTDATMTDTQWHLPLTFPDGDNVPQTLEVEFIDLAGNRTTQLRHVVVDSVFPTVTFDSPAANVTLSASHSPMAATASDGLGVVDVVQFRVPGAAVYGAPGAAGSWSADLPLPEVDHVQQTLEAIATDKAGNSTTASRTVWIDRVPPVVTIDWPVDGAFVNASDLSASGDVVVRFSVTDGDPAVTVTVNGVPAGSGAATALVPTSPTDNGVLKTVTVVATDSSGNSATQQLSFTVDRVVPTVAIQSPVAGALLGGPSATTGTATFTAQDGSKTVSSVAVTFDGAPVSVTSGAAPGAWSGVFPLPMVDYLTKTLQVTATDLAGNVGKATVAVVVDRVAPVVTITSPTMNAKFNASNFVPPNNDVLVSWTIRDGDGAAGTTSFSGGTVASSARSGPITTSPTDNPITRVAQVVSIDSAGNQGWAVAYFSVDRVAPTLTAASAKDHDTNVEPRQLSYTFSEPIVEDVLATFTTSRGPVRPGSWNTAHTTFTSGLFDPDSVVSATMQNVHDAYGNPWAAAATSSSTVHMAVVAPSGILAAGVATYDITSDSNGVPTVAVKYLNGDVEAWTYSAATGLRESTVLARSARPNLQVMKAVAGRKLGTDSTTPIRISGVTTFSCVLPSCSTAQTQDRKLFVGGVEVTGLSTTSTTPAGLVIPDANAKLTADGTGDFGRIDNKVYTRGTTTATLGVEGLGSVSGPTRWAALNWGSVGIQFTHVDQLGGQLNLVTQTISTSSAPANVSFAIDQTGSCFAIASGAALSVYPAAHQCGSMGCPLVTPVVATGIPNARVASFSPGSSERDLLVVGYDATNGIVFRKQKATSTCDAPMADVKPFMTAPAGSDFRPIQLGNKAGLAYLDPSSNLKVYVP